jgi:uncharacterized protein YecE (DUF72 family)
MASQDGRHLGFRLLQPARPGVLYASGYGKKDLDQWAERVAAWATGRNPPMRKASSTIPRTKSKRATSTSTSTTTPRSAPQSTPKTVGTEHL